MVEEVFQAGGQQEQKHRDVKEHDIGGNCESGGWLWELVHREQRLGDELERLGWGQSWWEVWQGQPLSLEGFKQGRDRTDMLVSNDHFPLL